MDKKYTSLNFKSKVKPVEKINEEFTLCKCYAFGLGKNRNYSHVSKENMERNKSTLSYAPVVGHLIEKFDKNGNRVGRYMGGHDYEITDDFEFRSICVPYGVVVADSFDYEMVEEYGDNVPREYLTCSVILWTGRYPELKEAIYSDDIYFNESAELGVEEYRPLDEDSNYTDLVDFTFSALCLLGKADDKNSEEHTEPCFIESKVIPQQFALSNAEFSEVMSELKNELAFYFNKDESTSENLEEGGIALAEEIKDEVIDETVADVVEEESTEETLEVEDEVVEESEEATVEEESAEDEEPSEYDLLKAEFEEYKANHSYANDEVEALKQFKVDTEAAQLHAQREAILSDAKFESVAETEEFKTLVSKMDEYSIAELEKEAKVILADNYSATFAYVPEKKPTTIKFSVSEDNAKEKPYGDLFD